MMKKIEIYFNITYYCLYKSLNKLDYLFIRLNPFRLINKLPFQKRRYKELGIDIDKTLEEFNQNRRTGLNIIGSGGLLISFLFFLTMSCLLIVKGIFDIGGVLNFFHFIVLALISIFLCFVFVFKKEKHLKYFEFFDKWSKDEKWKYFSIVYIAFIAMIGLFIWSLRF